MSRGVPLVVADAGSLPEVLRGGEEVGSAAGWPVAVAPVDPDDVAGWVAAMTSVSGLEDEQLEALRARELAVARTFTPRRTAAALMQAFRRAASNGGAASDRTAAGS